MWKIKKLGIMLPLSFVFALLSPGVGTCAPSQVYTVSETELQTLESNLIELERNNETLKTILLTSNEDLTEAINLLMQSQREIAKLKAELNASKMDLNAAQASLKIANDELAKAAQSFKAYERERDRTENRLRNQRNIWEVLCLVAVGVAVAK